MWLCKYFFVLSHDDFAKHYRHRKLFHNKYIMKIILAKKTLFLRVNQQCDFANLHKHRKLFHNYHIFRFAFHVKISHDFINHSRHVSLKIITMFTKDLCLPPSTTAQARTQWTAAPLSHSLWGTGHWKFSRVSRNPWMTKQISHPTSEMFPETLGAGLLTNRLSKFWADLFLLLTLR